MSAAKLLPSRIFHRKPSRKRTRRLSLEVLERRELLDGTGLTPEALSELDDALAVLPVESPAETSPMTTEPLLLIEDPTVSVGGLDVIVADPVPIESSMIWHNPLNASDVNLDGIVAPLDALIVISSLNGEGNRVVTDIPRQGDYFMDTNDDGTLSPADVLRVVSSLNRDAVSGSDEHDVTTTIADPILDANPFREVGEIQVYGYMYCTGTLITTQHVLTAAHCVDSAGGRSDGVVDFPVGAYSFSFEPPGAVPVTISARRVHIHPDYSLLSKTNANGTAYDEIRNDVALLFLERPVVELSLPWPSHFDASNLYGGDLSVGETAVIVGYGGANPGGRTGWVEIDKVKTDEIHWYTDLANESLIEPGDSGGPMLRRYGDSYKLIGIHCAADSRVGFGKDMRMKPFIPWIQTVIGLETGVGGPTANLLGKTSAERPDYVEILVEYSDGDGVNMSSVDAQDLRVESTDGSERATLQLVSCQPTGNGRVTATYAFRPSGHHPAYSVYLNDMSVRDQRGYPVRGAQLGSITLARSYNVAQRVDLAGGRDYQSVVQDTELDTDDWTRIDVGYEFQFSSDPRGVTGVRLKLWMEAWELEKNQQYKGKSRIYTARLIPLFELTDPNDPRRIVDLQTSSFGGFYSNLFGGELHGVIGLGQVGSLSGVEVRVDGRGRSDHLLQYLAATLQYKVVLSS